MTIQFSVTQSATNKTVLIRISRNFPISKLNNPNFTITYKLVVGYVINIIASDMIMNKIKSTAFYFLIFNGYLMENKI